LQQTSRISLAASLAVWFKIGLISFGGPAAQIALMHRELVERRRWISDRRFLHALNYCMVLPGPEAQQLATYLGWLTHGALGGILAGVLFVLPSLAIMIGAGSVYVLYGQQPEVQALLYGIKPAVLAIVLAACIKLSQRVLRGPFWIAIAAGALIGLLIGLSFVTIIILAALTGWVAHLLSRTPLKGLEPSTAPVFTPDVKTTQPTAQTASIRVSDSQLSDSRIESPKVESGFVIDDHTPTPPHAKTNGRHILTALATGVAIWALLYSAVDQFAPYVLADMAGFFTKAALVTFGGAYAVLPYVFDSAVNDYQWLSAAQMMDGLALGETTPGPLVMVNAFVGFVGAAQHSSLSFLPITWAGALGAVVVTVFTFLPSFVFILVGAPWVEATRRRVSLNAPLTAISAAVVGVIIDLALIFAQYTFFPDGNLWSWRSLDLVAFFIAVSAAIMMLQLRIGMLTTLLFSIGLGVVAVALQLP
jgi:chromate transporter